MASALSFPHRDAKIMNRLRRKNERKRRVLPFISHSILGRVRSTTHSCSDIYGEGDSKGSAFPIGTRLLSQIFACAKFREGGLNHCLYPVFMISLTKISQSTSEIITSGSYENIGQAIGHGSLNHGGNVLPSCTLETKRKARKVRYKFRKLLAE